MSTGRLKLILFAIGVVAAALIAVAIFAAIRLTGDDPAAPTVEAKPGTFCTLIGCSSGVRVMVTRLETVPEAKVLVLCEDGTCRETILHRDTFAAVNLSIDYEEPTDVSPELAILDRDRNPIVVAQTESRVERRYPNGKGCDDGTCVNVDLAFNASAETWTLGP